MRCAIDFPLSHREFSSWEGGGFEPPLPGAVEGAEGPDDGDARTYDRIAQLLSDRSQSRQPARGGYQPFRSSTKPLLSRCVRLQMVWDNLSCLGTEALARLG